jgi:hypothetical protein
MTSGDEKGGVQGETGPPEEVGSAADETGTTEETPKRDNRNAALIALAVLVVVLLGAIVGYIVSGGLSDDTASEIAGDSTTTTSVAVQPSTTAEAPTTVASSVPATTQIPGQLTIPALEDTYTDATEPDEVNGGDAILEIENEPPEVKLGLVRFEVTGVPEGGTIQSVTLQFTTIGAGSPIAVDLVEGDWNEAETNATNAPAIGERVGMILPAAELAELDVTAFVTGPGQIDFYLSAVGDDTTEFASKEAGVGGPVLVVRYGS